MIRSLAAIAILSTPINTYAQVSPRLMRMSCEKAEIERVMEEFKGGIGAFIPPLSDSRIDEILALKSTDNGQSSEVTAACKNLIINKGTFGAECDCPLPE